MIKPMISLASAYRLFIEVIAIINKKLLIRFVDGLQLMVPRNKQKDSDIIIPVPVADIKQLQRPSSSKSTC